jgi:hypothetical protein
MPSSVQVPQPRCKVISSRVSALTPAARSATVTIYDGRDCIGFISRHKAGYEAFNLDGVGKGRFPTQQDAVAALSGQIEELEGEVAP